MPARRLWVLLKFALVFFCLRQRKDSIFLADECCLSCVDLTKSDLIVTVCIQEEEEEEEVTWSVQTHLSLSACPSPPSSLDRRHGVHPDHIMCHTIFLFLTLSSSVTRLLFLRLGGRNLAVFHFSCSCPADLSNSLTSLHSPSLFSPSVLFPRACFSLFPSSVSPCVLLPLLSSSLRLPNVILIMERLRVQPDSMN